MHAEYGPLLDALRGVRWPARRAVAAAAAGTHRSRQRGTAGEFAEYRLYRQGDDPRALDWKLLGRSDRAFVRLSDDRSVLPTWIVLDGSASMAFPDGGPTSKWRAACAVAVGLAMVAQASGDPVGVLALHEGGVWRLPPRSRRGCCASRTADARRLETQSSNPPHQILAHTTNPHPRAPRLTAGCCRTPPRPSSCSSGPAAPSREGEKD